MFRWTQIDSKARSQKLCHLADRCSRASCSKKDNRQILSLSSALSLSLLLLLLIIILLLLVMLSLLLSLLWFLWLSLLFLLSSLSNRFLKPPTLQQNTIITHMCVCVCVCVRYAMMHICVYIYYNMCVYIYIYIYAYTYIYIYICIHNGVLCLCYVIRSLVVVCYVFVDYMRFVVLLLFVSCSFWLRGLPLWLVLSQVVVFCNLSWLSYFKVN